MKDQATRGEADKAVKDLAKNKDQLHPNQIFVYTFLKVDSECWHFWTSQLNLESKSDLKRNWEEKRVLKTLRWS